MIYALCSVTTWLCKIMKESVNEFIVSNKFVTGPSSTQQTFFNGNGKRTASSVYLAWIEQYLPCLASNKTSQCDFGGTTLCTCCPAVVLLRDVIDACHVHKSRIFLSKLQTEALIEDREQDYDTPLELKCKLFTCDTFHYDKYTHHGSCWALNARQFRLVL